MLFFGSRKYLLILIFAAVAFASWFFIFSNIGHKNIIPNSNQKEPTSIPPPFFIYVDETDFYPKEMEVNQGQTITFKNTGEKEHWPASNIHPTHQVYPQFDPLNPISPGNQWSFKFDRAGIWYFHDHFFPDLTGIIVVKENKVFINNRKEEKASGNLKNSNPPSLVSGVPAKNFEAEFASINMFRIAKNNNELNHWLKIMGAKKVMQKLLNDSGGGSTIDCHQESHAIGKMAYELFGASAFKEGDSSCHSGFYHGAMESLLVQKGTLNLAQNIDDICNSFNTGFGKFECLHGVGHGVVAYVNYNLPQALQICGQLKTNYDKNSCSGGAFMENVVSAQGFGAIPGHGTKWANQNPQFPCNAIDQSYDIQYQCYQMQTSWMLTLYNYNFEKVISECLKVRPDMISVCFKSTGRDAAGHTLRNPQKIIEICGKIPNERDYYNQCVIGALNVIVDFWGEKLGTKGSEFCKLIPENGKSPCYSTLASRFFDVFNNSVERKSICNSFESAYQNHCSTL